MSYSVFPVSVILLALSISSDGASSYVENSVIDSRKLNFNSINDKVVGIILKAGGRRYYASSELCPGGVFFPKPVDENCLCYNGIFQMVRHCCSPSASKISAHDLERRIDFKCGSSTGFNKSRPLRAILPLTKSFNRDGSVLVDEFLSGNNITTWRKFDVDDVIIRERGEVRLAGRKVVDIVNVKPLGRVMKMWMGENADIAVCYGGWRTDIPSTLKIEVRDAGPTKGCCFKVHEGNVPGVIKADCAPGSIFAQIVDIGSVDIDIGTCDQELPEEALHKLRKRNPDDADASYELEDDLPLTDFEPTFSIKESSTDLEDILGDSGRIIFRRNPIPTGLQFIQGRTRTPRQNSEADIAAASGANGNGEGSSVIISLPRKKGLAGASLIEQQKAINEFVAIIRNDFNAEIREPKHSFRFQLLKKAFDVFLKVVPTEIVPDIMIKTAFDIFYFLYESLDSVNYSPPDIHIRSMGYLDRCMQSVKPLNFSTFGCPKQIDELVISPEVEQLLGEFYKGNPEEMEMRLGDLRHPEIRKDKRFVPERNDIFVEISWKVVDFVHSFCFDYFKDEFNAHHFFERELEAVFLYPEVQKRWFTERPEKLKYVLGLFSVQNLGLRMKQLDKVVAVGHHLSRYNGSFWLRRPVLEPWYPRPKVLGGRGGSIILDDKEKMVFSKGIFGEPQNPAEERARMSSLSGRSHSLMAHDGPGERDLIYPYQIPDKLPIGELIWDGRAVCLHASYSNKRNYFTDKDLWGVNPSLFELGTRYLVQN